MRRLLLIATASLSLSSCALLRDLLNEALAPPRVRFEAARVSGASLEGASLVLAYRVENPNAISADISGVDVSVVVDGKAVAVVAPTLRRLGPRSTQELLIPVPIDFTSASAAGPVRYALKGMVRIGAPLPANLPLDHEGTIESPQRPKVTLALPRLTSLSLAGATLELPVQIENPNAFALERLAFAGAVNIAGVKVATVPPTELAAVGAGETKAISLPVQFELPKLASAATFQAGAAPLAIDGAVTSGKISIPVKWADTLRLPTLAFARLALSDVSFAGATVNLIFKGANPNKIAVDLGAADYGLTLDGKRIATAAPAQGLRLEPESDGELTVPLRVDFLQLGAGLIPLLQKKTVALRAEGSLGVPTVAGVAKLPVKEDTRLELPKLPQLVLAGPRLSNLSFTSATIDLPVEVKNPNAFALPVSLVQGALSIAGSSVASLASGELGEIAAGGSKKITLPVTVEFLKAVAAGRAIQSGSAPFAFDGTVVSSGLALPVRFSDTLALSR